MRYYLDNYDQIPNNCILVVLVVLRYLKVSRTPRYWYRQKSYRGAAIVPWNLHPTLVGRYFSIYGCRGLSEKHASARAVRWL